MGESINIREYLLMFKKRKWIILLILLLSIGLGVFLSYRQKQSYIPMYQAYSRIRINSSKNIPEQGFSPAVTSMNQNISNTYLSLAKSKSTLQEIIDTLGLDISTEILSSKITLTPDEANAEFINIISVDTNPDTAERIANALPAAFNNELIKNIGLDCVVVVDTAQTPEVPLSPPQSKTVIKYVIVGLVVSVFVVLLLEFLNNKVITPEDCEEYWGVPIIGVVPYDKPIHKKKTKKKQESILGGELNGSKI